MGLFKNPGQTDSDIPTITDQTENNSGSSDSDEDNTKPMWTEMLVQRTNGLPIFRGMHTMADVPPPSPDLINPEKPISVLSGALGLDEREIAPVYDYSKEAKDDLLKNICIQTDVSETSILEKLYSYDLRHPSVVSDVFEILNGPHNTFSCLKSFVPISGLLEIPLEILLNKVQPTMESLSTIFYHLPDLSSKTELDIALALVHYDITHDYELFELAQLSKDSNNPFFIWFSAIEITSALNTDPSTILSVTRDLEYKGQDSWKEIEQLTKMALPEIMKRIYDYDLKNNNMLEKGLARIDNLYPAVKPIMSVFAALGRPVSKAIHVEKNQVRLSDLHLTDLAEKEEQNRMDIIRKFARYDVTNHTNIYEFLRKKSDLADSISLGYASYHLLKALELNTSERQLFTLMDDASTLIQKLEQQTGFSGNKLLSEIYEYDQFASYRIRDAFTDLNGPEHPYTIYASAMLIEEIFDLKTNSVLDAIQQPTEGVTNVWKILQKRTLLDTESLKQKIKLLPDFPKNPILQAIVRLF